MCTNSEQTGVPKVALVCRNIIHSDMHTVRTAE